MKSFRIPRKQRIGLYKAYIDKQTLYNHSDTLYQLLSFILYPLSAFILYPLSAFILYPLSFILLTNLFIYGKLISINKVSYIRSAYIGQSETTGANQT